MTLPPPLPEGLLARYGLAGAAVAPLGDGLINHTWRVQPDGGEPRVLQRVNGIFPPAVNGDIAVVTEHLEARGLSTPRLLPTTDGRLWLELDGAVWRLMSFVTGVCRNALETPGQAHAAGALLGRFHRALDDLDHVFANPRLGVHDTPRHLAALATALETHRDHADYGLIAPIGETILARADALPPLPSTPDRIVHGDPKINNIIFADGGDEARCLIDLDTLGPMPLPLELGDAFRSWCNPGSEDTTETRFALDLFAAGVRGYAGTTRGYVAPDEWRAIVPATLTILVELAARFCADALNEAYFGWDPERFASRSEHNRVRAEGQLSEFDSLQARRGDAESAVAEAFTGR
jgi:Ser/Thr protein kinase RdoA (MazF antagonist)